MRCRSGMRSGGIEAGRVEGNDGKRLIAVSRTSCAVWRVSAAADHRAESTKLLVSAVLSIIGRLRPQVAIGALQSSRQTGLSTRLSLHMSRTRTC